MHILVDCVPQGYIFGPLFNKMMETGHEDELPLSRANTTAYLVCSGVLLVIGAIGNILLITAVLVMKQLRTIHNVFIFNLVVADCASLILLESLSIANFLYGQSPLGDDTRLCKVVSFFSLSADIGSVWSAASCALHIYFRVCHKAIFNTMYTPQIVTVMIFWLWSLCPMIVIPSLIGWGSHRFDSRLARCTYDSNAQTSFTYFMLTTGVWIPLSITVYCLVRTIVHLHNQPSVEHEAEVHQIHVSLEDDLNRTSQHIAPQICEIETALESQLPPILNIISVRDEEEIWHPPPPRRCLFSARDNLNTTRSVMAMSITMIIAWMTMSIVWISGSQKSFGDAQYIFALVLAHSPSCLNSIVYAVVNEDFRKAYKCLLTFRRLDTEQAQMAPEAQADLDNVLAGHLELSGT